MRRTETSLTDMLGEEFGPYKLVRRLGVGGMAETFVAVRSGPSGFSQRVCLKLVLPFFRDNDEFIGLFRREARLAAKLRHRNIVGVIDFGDYEGTPYMALELVDGLDLRGILDAQECERLPADYVALFGLELAEALEHAHNPPLAAGIEPASDDDVRGIVHRDISPSNVLVSRQGEILLTDFGVAKAITGTSRKQSAVKGKVPYMSPEQLRAESLDSRADLFALGVVLFEALAGRRPYDGAHDPATIMMILKGEHPPLADLAPDAPPGLCKVIESLIEADAANRPESASALIEALADYAPSPRIRRDLGQMVRRLGDEAKQKSAERGSRQPGGGTELLPSTGASEVQPAPWAEPANREATGARPSEPRAPEPFQPPPEKQPPTDPVNLVRPPHEATGPIATDTGQQPLIRRPSPAAPQQRGASELTREDRKSRTKLWLTLGALLVAFGALAGSAVLLWPSSEPADERKAEPTEAKPRPKRDAPPERDAAPEKPVEKTVEVAEQPPPVEPEAERPVAEPTTPTATPTPAPEAKPEPTRRAKEPAPTTTKAPSAAADPSRAKQKPRPVAKKPARLTISVFPWGNIWINGKPWGPAPLKGESMAPGTYKVSVGQSGPTHTKVVRLKAGQRKSVHFDLSAQ